MLLSIIFVGLAQNPMELLKPEREHIRSFPLFSSPSLLPASLLLPFLTVSFSLPPFTLLSSPVNMHSVLSTVRITCW